MTMSEIFFHIKETKWQIAFSLSFASIPIFPNAECCFIPHIVYFTDNAKLLKSCRFVISKIIDYLNVLQMLIVS